MYIYAYILLEVYHSVHSFVSACSQDAIAQRSTSYMALVELETVCEAYSIVMSTMTAQ
jgi:hypothetical protein